MWFESECKNYWNFKKVQRIPSDSSCLRWNLILGFLYSDGNWEIFENSFVKRQVYWLRTRVQISMLLSRWLCCQINLFCKFRYLSLKKTASVSFRFHWFYYSPHTLQYRPINLIVTYRFYSNNLDKVDLSIHILRNFKIPRQNHCKFLLKNKYQKNLSEILYCTNWRFVEIW